MNDTNRNDPRKNDPCQRHDKYDGSWWENDARGIPLARVCSKCRAQKLSKFRSDILVNPNYSADEAIEEDY